MAVLGAAGRCGVVVQGREVMFGCCFVLQGRQVCVAVVWCCREAGQACLLVCGAAGDEAGRVLWME